MASTEWRWSPYDQQLHLFERQVGDVAEALCAHSVPEKLLEEPEGRERRCVACVLILGQKVVGERGDPGSYGM